MPHRPFFLSSEFPALSFKTVFVLKVSIPPPTSCAPEKSRAIRPGDWSPHQTDTSSAAVTSSRLSALPRSSSDAPVSSRTLIPVFLTLSLSPFALPSHLLFQKQAIAKPLIRDQTTREGGLGSQPRTRTSQSSLNAGRCRPSETLCSPSHRRVQWLF